MKIPIFKKNLKIPETKTVKKISFYTLIIAILALVMLAIFFAFSTLNSKYVYNGIFLDGIDLSGISNKGLEKYIDEKYSFDFSNLEISIYDKDYSVKTSFADLDVLVDKTYMYDLIYNQGRKGNFFERIKEILNFNKQNLYLKTKVLYDEHKLNELVKDISNNINNQSAPPRLIIGTNSVTLSSGTYGYMVNEDCLKKRIINIINSLKSDIAIIPIDEIAPSKIDVDTIIDKINQNKKNASALVNENSIEIQPHIIGMYIKKEDLSSIVSQLENRESKKYKEVELPVVFDVPEITTKTANDLLFRDTLYSYETTIDKPDEYNISVNTETGTLNINEYKNNRFINIELATKAINGLILAPGEEFSFNEAVGMRTAQKGYKPAFVYYNDSIKTSIGGGICQVSSTLYNAAIKSNLKITERNPHSLRVEYVPLGLDATVSYGTSDLKFVNTTKWPIKINGDVKGNKLTFSIQGTNLNPNFKVELICTPYNESPYETEYIYDTSKPEGYSQVIQEGMDGVTVDTSFILINSENQSILKNYKIYTNTYKMLPEKILVGTGKIEK